MGNYFEHMLRIYNLSFTNLPDCLTCRQHVQVKNPYLDTMEEDILYHFSLSTKTHNLPEMFGDIKVCKIIYIWYFFIYIFFYIYIKKNVFNIRKARQHKSLFFFFSIVCVRWGQCKSNEGIRQVHPPGAGTVWKPRGNQRYMWGNWPLLHV